jgi:hypothetical protein
LGGRPLADWLTEPFELSSPSWRILCARGSMLTDRGSRHSAAHIEELRRRHRARPGNQGALEMLDVAITLNHLDEHEATSQFLEIVQNTSFIDTAQ